MSRQGRWVAVVALCFAGMLMPVLLAVLSSLSGCRTFESPLGPPGNCSPMAVRCDHERLERCSPDQRWLTTADCHDVQTPGDPGVTWACCARADEPTRWGCYPTPRCEVWP